MSDENENANVMLTRLCDATVSQAAHLMVENGASVAMALDRLLTYSAAQACHIDGAFETAKLFRHIADQVEGGAFTRVEVAAKGKMN